MVKFGMVGGNNGQLSPNGSMTRAALVTVLDRAVVQYINQIGSYTLTNQTGIILVAAGNIILSGTTSADIVITPAADGTKVAFENATVNGTVTVQADYATLTTKNSSVPDVSMTGKGSTIGDASTAAPVRGSSSSDRDSSSGGSSGGSSSGGGSRSGGSTTPSKTDVTIASQTEADAMAGKSYNNVTISDALGDGEVILNGVTINGNLTVNGGGSNSVRLRECKFSAKSVVYLNKVTNDTFTHYVSLKLNGTTIPKVEISRPATITTDWQAASKLPSQVKNVVMTASATLDTVIVNRVEVPADAENVVLDFSVSDLSQHIPISVVNHSPSTSICLDDFYEESDFIHIDTDGSSKEPGRHIHNWQTNEALTRKPTCTEAGETVYRCANGCGLVYLIPLPAYGHNWDSGVVIKDATCTSDGKVLYTCKNDPSHTRITILPSVHDWDYGTWYSDDTYHWMECRSCGAITKKDVHDWSGAAEDASGDTVSFCNRCHLKKIVKEVEVLNCIIKLTNSGYQLVANLTTSSRNDTGYYKLHLYNSAIVTGDTTNYYEDTVLNDGFHYYQPLDFTVIANTGDETHNLKRDARGRFDKVAVLSKKDGTTILKTFDIDITAGRIETIV